MLDRTMNGLFTALGLIALFVCIAHPHLILWALGAGVVIFLIANFAEIGEFVLTAIWAVVRWSFWPFVIGCAIYYFWWRPNHG